jgi:hypothetical protein
MTGCVESLEADKLFQVRGETGERGESGRLGFERRKRREVSREEERRSLQEGVRRQ